MSDLVNYNEQPRVLFIGGSGQLGIEVKSLKDKKNSFIFPSSSLLDLTNTQSISDCLDDKSPDIIINAGAYTNVDKAEEEKELCNKINNIGVELLAKEAIKRNIGIIHISTDYVFGKDSSGPFQAKNKKPTAKFVDSGRRDPCLLLAGCFFVGPCGEQASENTKNCYPANCLCRNTVS